MSAKKLVLKILSATFSLLLLIVVAFLLLRLGEASYKMGYRIFTESAVEEKPGQDVLVEIEQGMSSLEVSNILEEKGLIKSRGVFIVQMFISTHSDSIKTGLYTLNTSQTAREMLNVMLAEKVDEEESTDGD